jgi:RimJ/RimL family protein N-acetyltransferase
VRIDHVDAISAAAGGDRSTYGYTQVPDGRAETMDYVSMLLAAAADGSMGPFVQRRCGDDRVVGCTRYMSPAWPIGRTDPDEIEIGGTWLSADAQRTPINTEAKLLLLGYAFGTWNVQRVAICTDARNDRSRRAIERLGATFEGVMRRHRRSTHAGDGDRLRDTACYAITIDDWPTVQAALVARLNGHR